MDADRVSRRRVLCMLSGGAAATSGCLSYIPVVGAPEFGVPPEDVDCPFWDDDVRWAVSSSMDDVDEMPMRLEKSKDVVELPDDEIEFVLENPLDETFETNYYSYRLWKHVEGEWYHVTPWGWIQPWTPLEPGNRHVWNVSVDGDGYGDVTSKLEELDSDVLATEMGESHDPVWMGVGGGEYAFETDGWWESLDHESKTGFCTRFTVDGPELDVTPTVDAVAERDGDTVTVALEDEQPEEDEYPAAFVVSRVDGSAEEVERLIPEQVIRWRRRRGYAYRNTLPYFEEGVESVRYETYGSRTNPFGTNLPSKVEYRGEVYEIEVEEEGRNAWHD